MSTNTVITTFYTSHVDPQRDIVWKADYSKLKALIDSVVAHGEKLVILHDCFDDVEDTDHVKHVKVECKINPYYQRWFHIEQYLIDNPTVDNVFCVDGTDVVMLKSPFSEMEDDKLYVGDETKVLGDPYTRTDWPHPFMQRFVDRHLGKTLLNAGLCGASRKVMLDFLAVMLLMYSACGEKKLSPFDMSLFNLVCYTYFEDKIIHGEKVNTVFQSFTPNEVSWWMHK